MSDKKFWTGIGSRVVPVSIQGLQIRVAEELTRDDMHLLSGNAEGSDFAFQSGVFNIDPCKAKVILPWANYNRVLRVAGATYLVPTNLEMEIAANILRDTGVMSYIDKLKPGAKKMHCRNVFQIVNIDQPRSELCVFYASLDKNKEVKGGTRTAVGLALHYGIPTYNLFLETDRVRICEKLNIEYDPINSGVD